MGKITASITSKELMSQWGHKHFDQRRCFLVSHGHTGSPFEIDRYGDLNDAVDQAKKWASQGFSVDFADVCKPAGDRIIGYGKDGKLIHYYTEKEIR